MNVQTTDPPRAPRIGALFAGYSGLEMGVQAILGGSTAWVSEIDPGACRILAHRLPGVPNLGDITAVDWANVEPVDVLTGGFPCQDVSHAGARKGLGPGTRSGLWSRMADAIDHLRPSLVIAENVRGLLSAEAASDVEPCPWCLGDGPSEPPLRALGAVLADLAELGYDAAWYGLRAADVGAPHGRFRVFVLAWLAGGAPIHASRGGAAAGQLSRLWDVPVSTSAAADADGWQRDRREREPFRGSLRRVAPAGGGAGTGGWLSAADADGDGLGGLAELDCPAFGDGEEGQHRGHADGLGMEARGLDWGLAGTDSDGDASGVGVTDESVGGGTSGLDVGAVAGAVHRDRAGDPAEGVHVLGRAAAVVAWGPYEPAIRRWERRLGRPAPVPTEPGSKGQPRLSPAFVEWLMGLPAGWVTDVPGLSRNDQLKALGNGVVPQQAAAAVRFMLARLAEDARWAA